MSELILPELIFPCEYPIKVMGKDVGITKAGTFSTDIHVNPWVVAPFLYYVLQGKGLSPTGDWRSFRELADGKERATG